jgi:hypothetical protein
MANGWAQLELWCFFFKVASNDGVLLEVDTVWSMDELELEPSTKAGSCFVFGGYLIGAALLPAGCRCGGARFFI